MKISSKHRVAIPQRIRKALGLKQGQTMRAIQYGERIELVPLMSIRNARGFLAGIDTDVESERA